MSELETLYQAILTGDRKTAVEFTRQSLEDRVDPHSLVDAAMIPAMDEAGRLFEAEDYFVPELLLAARAMKAALALIRPLLVESGVEPKGCAVIGTVKGDLHDIGKNLVAAMLEGAGYEIVDLGTDVTPEQFVNAVRDAQADIVGLSALLTVTMPAMKDTVEALQGAGVRDKIKVIIGGAPVSSEYADEIGADAYADNAASAVRVTHGLIADLLRDTSRNWGRGWASGAAR